MKDIGVYIVTELKYSCYSVNNLKQKSSFLLCHRLIWYIYILLLLLHGLSRFS